MIGLGGCPVPFLVPCLEFGKASPLGWEMGGWFSLRERHFIDISITVDFCFQGGDERALTTETPTPWRPPDTW